MKKDRFYKNSKGQYVPSGTTVLMPFVNHRWAANCAVDYINFNSNAYNGIIEEYDALDLARTAFERESDEAADYGTYIHAMCQYSLENDMELESPHEMTNNFMAGLWKWRTKHNVKVIAMEQEVITSDYGGRLDLVCEMDGVVTLVDFKTGKGSYYENWKYQLAGYRQAWNGSAVTVIPKDGVYLYPKIQHHGILKFNKQKTKTKGYSTNYKSFTEYSATRPKVDGKFVNGKLETEKYTRTYEDDRRTFNALVGLWWLIRRGIQV